MAKVLLVADVPWVVNDVRAALSDKNYDLILEDDPREAAGVWLDEEPDAIVVDLQVGSMGGFAVTRDLRDTALEAGFDPTPTVMLLDRSVDGFLAGRSGAHGWLVKPFTAFELRDLVDRLMASPAADPV